MDDYSLIQNLGSTEEDLGYIYEIELMSNCELFNVAPMSVMPNLSEMIITSTPFGNYKDCVNESIDALNVFAQKLHVATGKRYTVATKINPMHDPSPAEDVTPSEQWNESIVLRMFLADTDVLKKENTLKWSICAVLSVRPMVDLNKFIASHRTQ